MTTTDAVVYELEKGVLGHKLLALRENGILTDVTLTCCGREIRAHRCILAANSQYFRYKFCQTYGQSYLDQIQSNLDLSEETGNMSHLEQVIDFMYSGTITVSPSNVGSILNLAVFCGCDDLILFCAQYLQTSLSSSNCIRIYFSIRNYKALTSGAIYVPGLGMKVDVLNDVFKYVRGNINKISFSQKDTGLVTKLSMEQLLREGVGECMEVEAAVRCAVEWLYDHLNNTGIEGCVVFLNVAASKTHTQTVSKKTEDNIFGLRERLKSLLEYSDIDSQLKTELLSQVAVILTELSVGDSIASPQGSVESPQGVDEQGGVDEQDDDTMDMKYTAISVKTEPEPASNGKDNHRKTRTRASSVVKKTSRKAGSLVLECEICSKTFGRQKNLVRHRLRHKKKVCRCIVCEAKFSSKTALLQHMNKKHVDSVPYECGVCQHLCTDVEEVAAHQNCRGTADVKQEEGVKGNNDEDGNVHSDVESEFTETKKKQDNGKAMYLCLECGKVFKRNYHLTRHKRSHTGQKPFQCGVCDQSFIDVNTLDAHTARHKGEKPFECENCSKNFYSKAYKNLHYKICTNQLDAKRHKCDLCEKLFFRTSHLKQHMTTHSGVQPYHCAECDITFKGETILTRHNITHHSDRNTWAICDICGKSFAHKESLRRHMFAHTGAKPYTCEICSKSFTQKTTLTVHMRSHTGIKSYQCDLCAMLFFNSSALMKHRRNIHLGVKPHACEVCNKKFGQKGDLLRHMPVHTGIKKFKCPVCFKAFASKGRLPQHMRTHTGEKPHRCDICGHGFIQKGDLKKHMGTHNKSTLSDEQRQIMQNTLASKGRVGGSRLNENLTSEQRELLLSKVTDRSINSVIDRSLTEEQREKLLTTVLNKSLQEAIQTTSTGNVTSQLTLEIMAKQMQTIVSDAELKEQFKDEAQPANDNPISHNTGQLDIPQASNQNISKPEYMPQMAIPHIDTSAFNPERPFMGLQMSNSDRGPFGISTSAHLSDQPMFPLPHVSDPDMAHISERPRMAHMSDRQTMMHPSEQPSMAHLAPQMGPAPAHGSDRSRTGQGQSKVPYWPYGNSHQ